MDVFTGDISPRRVLSYIIRLPGGSAYAAARLAEDLPEKDERDFREWTSERVLSVGVSNLLARLYWWQVMSDTGGKAKLPEPTTIPTPFDKPKAERANPFAAVLAQAKAARSRREKLMEEEWQGRMAEQA